MTDRIGGMTERRVRATESHRGDGKKSQSDGKNHRSDGKKSQSDGKPSR
ncbi:hypothetical protein ACIQ57_00465 [Lysinibacillus xylanilyticus]